MKHQTCIPRFAISVSMKSRQTSSSQMSYGMLPSAFTANSSAPLKITEHGILVFTCDRILECDQDKELSFLTMSGIDNRRSRVVHEPPNILPKQQQNLLTPYLLIKNSPQYQHGLTNCAKQILVLCTQ